MLSFTFGILWHLYVFHFQLDNYEIRKGKYLKVNVSVANLRLFVGNIPKSKTKEEIQEEFSKKTGVFYSAALGGVKRIKDKLRLLPFSSIF